MKKPFAFIIAIISFLICAVCLSACAKHPTKAEVTPTVLGAHEGLWMYSGNTRSRTDGTEQETLMESVTVEGVELSTEDFIIRNYCYLTSASKVFFALTENGNDRTGESFLYLYDYKEKTGKYICALSVPSTHFEADEDNKIMYITCGTEKFLCGSEGNILYSMAQDEEYIRKYDYYFSGYSNGVFYCSYRLAEWVQVSEYTNTVEYSYKIEWWKDGETHTIEIPEALEKNPSRNITVTDSHLFIADDYEIISINLNTRSLIRESFKKIEYSTEEYESATRSIGRTYYSDDAAYVLTVAYFNKDADDYDIRYYFFKITDEGATKISEFGAKGNYGYDFHEYEGSIYIRICLDGRGRTNYYRYDLENGKLTGIKKSSYRAENKSSASAKRREKQVGDYRFFVTSRGYGNDTFMGFGYAGYCYYLNREYNGATEILQYSFESTNFFDDVCPF